MRVVKARQDHKCSRPSCGSPIQPGDLCVRVGFEDKHNHGMSGRGKFIFNFFHDDCYIQYRHEQCLQYVEEAMKTYKRKEATKKQRTPKKMGRPAIYRDTLKARNLMTKIGWHRRKGNVDKAREFQKELDDLRW